MTAPITATYDWYRAAGPGGSTVLVFKEDAWAAVRAGIPADRCIALITVRHKGLEYALEPAAHRGVATPFPSMDEFLWLCRPMRGLDEGSRVEIVRVGVEPLPRGKGENYQWQRLLRGELHDD